LVRKLSMVTPLLLLAACGSGGEQAANLTDADAGGIGDARSYAGDNLSSIDAAANDAAIQPLAPDTPVGNPAANDAVVAE
jgi:hypothetical protein